MDVVELMMEDCMKEFETLKQRYHNDMLKDELMGLLEALTILHKKFNNAFEFAELNKRPINDSWRFVRDECSVACKNLARQIESLNYINHPIKFLDPLVNQHETLIRWIDAIQDTFGEDFKDLEISLPRIVVVGEESVGKSSVLESIVGMALFPRAEGICTRLPFQLRLHRKSPERMLKDYGNNSDPIVSFASDPNTYCVDPEQVAKRVTEITQEKTGGRGVKDDVVILNVFSRKVTDLTLIDLPGIVHAHRPGEPENMRDITIGIVESYIKEEDTIILAVVPANFNLGNSQALYLAQKAKALHRTVAVITKIDIASARDKVELKIRGIAPGSIDLPHGYIGMVNPDTEGGQEFKSDVEFFEKNYPELLKENRVGRTALLDKLNVLLDQHIRNVWADKTKIKIISRQKDVKAKLDVLGPPLPPSNIKEFFQGELAKFCTQFRTVLDAKQSTLFLILETKYREAVFAAKKAKKQDMYRDPITEVLEKADLYLKEEVLKDMLEKCKLTRFTALCEYIITEYNKNTQQAKEEIFKFVQLMLSVNSADLPGSVVCASESEKPNCPICREEIPLPNKGGIVKFDCRHCMHVECFINLVEKRAANECPICRQRILRIEKVAQSGSTVDPVLLFVFKAIAKYLVPAAKDKFTAGLEHEFTTREFEEHVREAYKETDEISAKRKIYNEQQDVLRQALVTVMNYLEKSIAT